VHQPYDDIIDYDSFSIRLSVDEVPGMVERLKGVSHEQILRYRLAMLGVYKVCAACVCATPRVVEMMSLQSLMAGTHSVPKLQHEREQSDLSDPPIVGDAAAVEPVGMPITTQQHPRLAHATPT
jgi:hypothetical protein